MSTTDSQPETKVAHRPSASSQSIFSLPVSIRQLFDAFPLRTYSTNVLPQRAKFRRDENTLWIFMLNNEVLSPNPACLKWQAFLITQGIPFATVSANNHASPTGALPFVLPAQQKREIQPQAIVSSKIQRWVENQTHQDNSMDLSLDAYIPLIDSNLRTAWLYSLYLHPDNFRSVAESIYITSSTANNLVHMALAYQLRTAARDELLKTRAYIDNQEIYSAADSAFFALETKLADNPFFSHTDIPSLFDTSLFSYTHLILSFASRERTVEPTWRDETLLKILLKYQKLVDHRNRLLDRCVNPLR